MGGGVRLGVDKTGRGRLGRGAWSTVVPQNVKFRPCLHTKALAWGFAAVAPRRIFCRYKLWALSESGDSIQGHVTMHVQSDDLH